MEFCIRSIPRNDGQLLFVKLNLLQLSEKWAKNPKYPSSPSCKRCELGVAYSSGIRSVEAKVLSSPPGKYGRKTET